MEELPQKQNPEQLHTDEAPVQEPEYTLEEIMREFGGWTKREEEPAPKAPEPVEAAAQEGRPQDAAEPPPEQQAQALKNGDTIRFTPIREEDAEAERPKIWTYQGEPAPEPAETDPSDPEQAEARARRARAEREERKRRKRMERLQKKREQAKKSAPPPEQPERVFASAAEAYQAYAKKSSLKGRTILSFILCLLSAAMLVLCNYSVAGVDLSQKSGLLSGGMLIVMLLQTLLAYDIFLSAIGRCIRLRFDHVALLLLLVLVTALDAVGALMSGRIPFCTAVSVELTMALWGELQLRLAKRKTARAVCNMQEPFAAVREEKAWSGKDCIFRASGDEKQFVYQLELPDATRRVMRVYAPVTAGLTALLAVIAALRPDGNFLWSWAAMLLAGYPIGILIAYPRPFAIQSRRLSRGGTAVAGWQGAKNLGGECAVAIEDADLFPPQNVTQGGMKLYGSRPAPMVIGYANAVVQTAGSGLVPLFEQMMHDQNGRRYTVDSFRRYESGGLGATIRGDVVLMGSIAFMKLMRVRVPEGTRLKQAVYLSVNGELTAVFALNYAPAESVRAGLASVLRAGALVPVLATRDFMITPQFLKQRYKIPPEHIEFPIVEERAALSEPETVRSGTQGALMARSSFASFAGSVVAARGLRSTAILCICIALVGSILGAGLMFVLTFLGADLAASCWNLFLYTALWLLPGLLAGLLAGRA